jgi:hypothetical protein
MPSPAAADTVTDWWELANRFYMTGQTPSGPRLPDAERASTRAALAMFEAVNAIDRRYESYLNLPAVAPGASQDAAAATAAFKVLLQHYPAQKAALEESYAMAMVAVPEGPPKEAGRELGERAAAAAVAAGGIDPAVPQPPYRPRTAPGQWIGASTPALEPYWLAFKPWIIASADALMPPPPPALASARYARDFEEVRRLGGRNSKERSAHQTLIAKYRQGFSLSPSVRLAADAPGRRQVDNARMLALYQMATDDALQAMAAAKLHYNYWRPITAIRNGDRDGNEATQHDPAWVPLLPTPDFSEYPCGHCTGVAVQAEVLKSLGGIPEGRGVRVASAGNPNSAMQTVASWDELVRQVSDSRMLGGVHYRFSNEAGEEIGRQAARIAIAKALRPLPAVHKPRPRAGLGRAGKKGL